MTDACREAFAEARKLLAENPLTFAAFKDVFKEIGRLQAASTQSAEIVRELKFALEKKGIGGWSQDTVALVARANAFLEGRQQVSEKEAVNLMGKAYMMSGEDKGCYSQKAMIAAYRALLAAQGKGDASCES